MASALKNLRCSADGCTASQKNADTFIKLDGGQWVCRRHLPAHHPLERAARAAALGDAKERARGTIQTDKKPEQLAARVRSALDERVDNAMPGLYDREDDR